MNIADKQLMQGDIPAKLSEYSSFKPVEQPKLLPSRRIIYAIPLVGLLIVVGGLLAVTTLSKQQKDLRTQAGGSVVVSMSPTQTNIPPASETVVNIFASTGGQKISAAELKVSLTGDGSFGEVLVSEDFPELLVPPSIVGNSLRFVVGVSCTNDSCGVSTNPSVVLARFIVKANAISGTGSLDSSLPTSSTINLVLNDQTKVVTLGAEGNQVSLFNNTSIAISSGVLPTPTPIGTVFSGGLGFGQEAVSPSTDGNNLLPDESVNPEPVIKSREGLR